MSKDLELDRLVHEHLPAMPETARQLLAPHIAEEAPDAWMRSALMAYLRYFTRVFELEQDRTMAESRLAESSPRSRAARAPLTTTRT